MSNTLLSTHYGPLRLPAWAAHGYLFPLAVAARCRAAPLPGLPGSSADLSLRAAPSHPGKSGDCLTHCFIADIRLHPNRADCPLPSRNEAETGLLTLRLAGSPFEASSNGSLRSTLDWLHVEWAIYMVSSLHLTRSARLGLAHPMDADAIKILIRVHRRPQMLFERLSQRSATSNELARTTEPDSAGRWRVPDSLGGRVGPVRAFMSRTLSGLVRSRTNSV